MSKNSKKLSKEANKIIKELCYSTGYQILDGTHERPKHIRLLDLDLDVWPTTGTVSNRKGKYYKGERGLNYLAELLGRKVENKKASMTNRIDELERQVVDLIEVVEDLQFTIEILRL